MTMNASAGVWGRLEDALLALQERYEVQPGDPSVYRLAYAPQPDTQAGAEALLREMNAKLAEIGLPTH